MKQKCIRCVVQLTLAELLWQDENEVDIHLEGPALFVRACVLRQLQHSQLHKPVFPVRLNQELTFDRVLTNCKNPSLFNEVIRGEHVKIEIIQVSPDYRGGKILARFESPAHKFLFPDQAPPTGELQHVLLNKSRKYEHPPLLTFTCSTTLLETTVQSPVDVIFNESKLDTTSYREGDGGDGDEDRGSSRSSQTQEEEDGRHLDEDERERLDRNGGLTVSALGSSGRYSTSRQTPTSSRRLFSSTTKDRSQYQPLSSLGQSCSTPHSNHRYCETSMVYDRHTGGGGGLSTQERLHSLLEPYSTPERERDGEGERDTKPVYRVKFKPPVPKFTTSEPTTTESDYTETILGKSVENSLSCSSSPHHKSSLYESMTSSVGPHEWEVCPRRSPKRVRSQSAPTSPLPRAKSPKHIRSSTVTLPNQVPLDTLDAHHLECMDPILTTMHLSAPELRPPFVVRHVDPTLLERRNFCGESCQSATTKHSTQKMGGSREGEGESGIDAEAEGMEGVFGHRDLKLDGVTFSGLYNRYLAAPQPQPPLSTQAHHHTTSGTAVEPPTSNKHPLRSSLPPAKSPLKSSLRATSKSAPTSPYKTHPARHADTSASFSSNARRHVGPPFVQRTEEEGLLSKYLVSQPGNTRAGMCSPSVVIQEKLERLKRECCKCLRSPDTLGEDDLSEDLDRLKASLEAERQDTLNRSAKMLPDQSVTVKIGPRDYWSERMSEYTGKRHRVIFDETLEKIYNRLYTEASQSH